MTETRKIIGVFELLPKNDVAFPSGVEIIQADHFISLAEQTLAKM